MQEYTVLRDQVQAFSTSLLDHARSSYELEVMLNYAGSRTVWVPGHHQAAQDKNYVRYTKYFNTFSLFHPCA